LPEVVQLFGDAGAVGVGFRRDQIFFSVPDPLIKGADVKIG
jgi:hypothetical protein